MSAEQERRAVDRWVDFVSNIGYFIFGVIVFTVLFLGIIAFVAWLTKPSWVDELFSNHLSVLLSLSALAGGLLGVGLKNKLTRYFFGGGDALD